MVGVYATTSRAPIRVISVSGDEQQMNLGRRWAQVGRQGNALFCEGLVAVGTRTATTAPRPRTTRVCSASTPRLRSSPR